MKAESLGYINQEAPLVSKDNQFVIVDVSHPDYLESFVNIDQVIEVYDHHFGHEEFWHNRLGGLARIEPVGACATLIWEAYKTQGFHNIIEELSANFLYAAIMANTLNFRASVTTERDRNAARELLPLTNFPEKWVTNYYSEIEKTILKNLSPTLQNDTKTVAHGDSSFFLSQIELWNASIFLTTHSTSRIYQTMDDLYPDSPWVLNLISIEENCNYLITNTDIIKRDFSKFMNLKPHNSGCLTSDRLWLRKEILRDLIIFAN